VYVKKNDVEKAKELLQVLIDDKEADYHEKSKTLSALLEKI